MTSAINDSTLYDKLNAVCEKARCHYPVTLDSPHPTRFATIQGKAWSVSCTDDSLQACTQSCDQRSSSLCIVKVFKISEVAQVERYVFIILRDQDNLSAQRMRDPNLVKDVRIPASAVANDNTRTVNKGRYVLHNRRRFPHVVCAARVETGFTGGLADFLVDSIKASIERHHHRDQRRLDLLMLFNRKYCWPLSAWMRQSEYQPKEIHVLYGPVAP